MKTAWVFPGQGSQVLNMGVDLQEIPAARSKFQTATDILGWSVLEVCQVSEAQLSRTVYTQPCLFVIETILADLLLEQGHTPHFVAGHSLGEYSALYSAKVFDFATGLKLVKARAELMDNMAQGKMAALMKFDRQVLAELIDIVPDVVVANDNSEQQIVISGTVEGVDTLLDKMKAKRAITLKVSGAFHSPLMAQASESFQAVLDTVAFTDAQVPVLSNVAPTPSTDAQELKCRLSQQMTNSVRWREIMLELGQRETKLVVEVGPGNVLTGLMKRTCPQISLKNVQTAVDI